MHDGLEVEQESLMQKRMLDFFLPVYERMHPFPGLLFIRKQVPATPSRFLCLIHGQICCRQ